MCLFVYIVCVCVCSDKDNICAVTILYRDLSDSSLSGTNCTGQIKWKRSSVLCGLCEFQAQIFENLDIHLNTSEVYHVVDVKRYSKLSRMSKITLMKCNIQMDGIISI